MATSGSVDHSATRDQIIQEVLEDLGVMQPGDTTSSARFTDYSSGLARKLNNIVKQLGNPTDGSPGMQAWAIKTYYLFLQKGQAVYTLGPTVSNTTDTDKWASSYVSTTISADEAAGQTVITVVDNGTISNGNRIGIQLDTGYMQWTTVNGAPTDNGSTIDVTITAALTSQASAGNRVFVYATTAQGRRPLDIATAVLRDTDGNDFPLDSMDLDDYESITKKSQESTPGRFYYQPTLTDGTIHFDCAANDVTKVVRMRIRSPFEDFDAAANDLDFDPIWIKPLVYSLELESCLRFGKQARMAEIKALRDESLAIARNQNPETCNAYFMPGEAG
jgi:hypothetical protein